MRAIVTGLVATCLVASSGDAAARSEWVVLRVERVEVAAAHADGSPWDDDGDKGLACGAGSEELLGSSNWGRVVKPFCIRPGTAQKGPDLRLRLSADDVAQYVSPIAEDALVHDFQYGFLVPLDALQSTPLTIEVFDQDGVDPNGGEPLGVIKVTTGDVKQLLAGSSRIKTFADASVTRLELTARRYTRGSRKQVSVGAGRRVARFATSVVAGEFIELRASRTNGTPTVVVGGNLSQLVIGRCTRALVTASGGIAAGFDDHDRSAAIRFDLRVLTPSLTAWHKGIGWTACDDRRLEPRSTVAILQLQTLTSTTLTPANVRPILQSRYLAGIQRCHERALKIDPMQVGRVRLLYTVGPTGGVAKALAKGVDPALDACIESLATRWRFGAPKDANGKPTSEDVEALLLLDAK